MTPSTLQTSRSIFRARNEFDATLRKGDKQALTVLLESLPVSARRDLTARVAAAK